MILLGKVSEKVREFAVKNFYRCLLSSSWVERLRAYSCIERDLRSRHRWGMSDDKWEDMKMLVGQILSIHFKKYPARDIQDFTDRLNRLYKMLLSPIADEISHNHVVSMRLLLDIYDDDDIAARQSIRNFFGQHRYEVNYSVLTNLFRCYEEMMQQVTSRYMTLMA